MIRCCTCGQYGHEDCGSPRLLALGEAVSVDQARRLLASMPIIHAARELGVCRNVARRWAGLLGIPVRRGPRGPRRPRG